MSRTRIAQVSFFLGLGWTCCQIAAGDLITPYSVIASTEFKNWSANRLIDNSGLSGAGDLTSTHDEASQSNSWVTPNNNDNNTYYYSWASAPVLTFQLDQHAGLHLVEGIAIWNYSPPASYTATAKNCAKYIAVAFSQTGVGGPFGAPLLLPRLEKGFAGASAQRIYFGQGYLANAVRLTILDNWHDEFGGGDRVGLSEVKFMAPEPSSLVLVGLCALFGVGCLSRQRGGG